LSEQHKAKPTLFNEVLYRSKSEARLAVCFDSWMWNYSYESVSVGKWKADFVTRSGNEIRVIEYKPVMPTEEYLRDLRSNFLKVMDAAKANPLLIENRATLSCELWCVDFWNDVSHGFYFCQRKKDLEPLLDFSSFDFSPGKEFRFDLNSTSKNFEDMKRIAGVFRK
jgi:hypothetical protein